MNNQIDSLHDFAYIGITYMGMSEEESYKWANDMIELIRNCMMNYINGDNQNCHTIKIKD